MNQIDLKNRVAVVTGGAQGIGYAISERLLRSGATVAMWDMDAAKLDEAKASLSKLGKVGAMWWNSPLTMPLPPPHNKPFNNSVRSIFW